MKAKRRIKQQIQKTDNAYRQLWRIVDGAVADAFLAHPDYLSNSAHERTVRASLNKRVVGAVLGYAKARGADPEMAADKRCSRE